MKPTPNLDDLMLFHAVLAAGSLTRAGANLRLAKSTISRRLARLEDQMGTLLLKRDTRKLTATDIGLDLFERCERIAAEVADLGEATERSRTEVDGTLRISMPSEFGSAWLGKAISDFALQYPDLRLELNINTHMVDLIEEPYDVAIHFGKLKASRLTYRLLATISRGIYASPEYLRRHGTPSSLEQLRGHQFIVTDVQQREGTLSLRNEKSRRSIPLASRVSVNSMRLARELVIGGVGLGLLPNGMSQGYVESGALVRLLPSWKVPPVQATATMLARDRIPRKTRVFLDFIAGRLAGSGHED